MKHFFTRITSLLTVLLLLEWAIVFDSQILLFVGVVLGINWIAHISIPTPSKPSTEIPWEEMSMQLKLTDILNQIDDQELPL